MRIPWDAESAHGEFIDFPEMITAILITLRDGWQQALQRDEVHANAGEVEITECLRDGMRIACKSLPWAKSMIIQNGMESRSAACSLTPDGLTDIPITWVEIFVIHGEHEPHAIIECKRIKAGDAHLCREYVKEGMDRFANGKYSPRHLHAYLAAYVQAGKMQAAVDGINAHLQRKQRNSEQLQTSTRVPELTLWQSQHPRHLSKPITLHHSFFPCWRQEKVPPNATPRQVQGASQQKKLLE